MDWEHHHQRYRQIQPPPPYWRQTNQLIIWQPKGQKRIQVDIRPFRTRLRSNRFMSTWPTMTMMVRIMWTVSFHKRNANSLSNSFTNHKFSSRNLKNNLQYHLTNIYLFSIPTLYYSFINFIFLLNVSIVHCYIVKKVNINVSLYSKIHHYLFS